MTNPDYEIITGDCIEVMRGMKTESGELVLFDVMEKQPHISVWSSKDEWMTYSKVAPHTSNIIACPFVPGERLWVAEDWAPSLHGRDCLYRTDELPREIFPVTGWKPAATLMRCDSRATLTTASVEPVEHEGKWCWKRVMKKVEERDE